LFFGSRFGIWAMVYATLAGSLLHAVIVAWMMERTAIASACAGTA
jgi:hypothetical protein